MRFEVNPQIYLHCQLLQNPDPAQRYSSIRFIRDFVSPYSAYGRGEDHDWVKKRLDTKAKIVVPAILEAGSLYDANPDVRIKAAHVLEILGTSARSALHDLIISLKDQDERVREDVLYDIWGSFFGTRDVQGEGIQCDLDRRDKREMG